MGVRETEGHLKVSKTRIPLGIVSGKPGILCVFSSFLYIPVSRVYTETCLPYNREAFYTMNIRRAREQDMPDIDRLLIQVNMVHHKGRPDLFKAGQKKYTDEQLKALIHDDSRPIFVAADEEEHVLGYAFCIFQQHLNDNILTDIKTLYIDDLCVDESLRGRHIGRALYEAVLGFARESGCYNVTLNVWSLNDSAMSFYERCGLKPQKVGMETIL